MANKKQKPPSKDYTVDAVEVVHGRWIKVHEWCSVEVLRCSACGREHPRLATAYCCDCGAKMDGGNEDE